MFKFQEHPQIFFLKLSFKQAKPLNIHTTCIISISNFSFHTLKTLHVSLHLS